MCDLFKNKCAKIYNLLSKLKKTAEKVSSAGRDPVFLVCTGQIMLIITALQYV